MDGQIRDGNAFEIPDLWKPSILAHFDEHAADSTPSDFEPLSIDLLLGIRLRIVDTDTLRQVCKAKAMEHSSFCRT